MSRTYITYLNFGEACISLVCELIIFHLYSNLLFISVFKPNSLRISKTAKPMRLYFIINIFYSLSSCVNHFYAVFWWRPGSQISLNPLTIFWASILSISFAVLPPIAVFFLTVERCLALNFPGDNRLRKCAFGLSIFVAILAFGINITFILLELPLHYDQLWTCVSFGCLMKKYNLKPHLYTKLLFSTLNLMLGLVFVYQLSLKKVVSKHIKNRVVIITLILEFIFIALPNYSRFAFEHITGESSIAYFGQHILMLLAIDEAFCSIFYSLILIRKRPIIHAKVIIPAKAKW